MGLRPGKEFAQLLQAARAAQLDGLVTTADETLHWIGRMRAVGGGRPLDGATDARPADAEGSRND